jgi:TubC N-terminal docking domain
MFPSFPIRQGYPLCLWEACDVGPTQLMARLLAAGCQLIPEGEQLRVRDPQKALTDELRALIRQSKPAILELLRQGQSVTTAAEGKPGKTRRPPAQPNDLAMTPTSSGRRRPPAASRDTGQPPQTQASEPAEKLRAEPQAGDATLELPFDRVVQQFLERQPEVWKRDHIVIRFDRQVKAYLVRFAAPALDALCHYVATCTAFGNAAERDHYAATLTWLIDHGVPRLAHTPYRPGDAPEVLPDQLPLFD